MKRLLLLITFLSLCLFSFTQTNIQQDQRVNQILKNALSSKCDYYIYGRTGAARFINIAVLNQSSHTLSWITCHGRLFDSTKLTGQEFEQVTSKQLDPFVLYQNICDKYLANIAAAKDIYRVYGDIQLFEKLNGNYRALFAMETVQAAKTPLQKLIAIENVRKRILTQLAYLNCTNPSTLSHDPLYATNKKQAGIMVKTNDSTVYYNFDPTSAVAKISLYKKSAGQFYIQNRFSEIIDSVAIQPEKYELLQKEKTDVFLLYRGWLEMQWQGALSAIRRQSAGLYNQVNVQNEKEVKELYKQLNAIGAKINQLNSPEVKSIEQAVYDIYKNETSEISYFPLLGIGYNLTQTRGQKEYELTNHLGNVLATVSDKKIGVSSTSDNSLIDHYEPDIVSAQDYYPFGMLQPGRSYLSAAGGKYRYGFNGKENDNEVKGEGNQQDYGMRVHDPRLGRFLSVDPLMKGFPMLTPYQFASNLPIAGIDMDGKEFVLTIYSPSAANSFTRAIQDYKDIYAARNIAYQAINQNMSPKEYEDLKNADIFPNSENDSRKFMRTDGKSATLEYDKDAPQGLTVHMNRGQGDVGSGYTQTWAQSLHFKKGTTNGHEDANYPVDVRIINSQEYKDYYKDWDFRGTYMSDNASLWIGTSSRGTMEGYLKGSGFVQYTVDAIGVNATLNGFKGGSGLSRSGGEIWGKAEPGVAIDPGVLAGWGAQVSGGYSFGVGIETGIWGSFQDLHDARNFNTSKATFTGGFKGFNVGLSGRWKKLPDIAKGSSVTPAVSNSTLITP